MESQISCQACREATVIDLAEVRRPADTPVWKLGRLPAMMLPTGSCKVAAIAPTGEGVIRASQTFEWLKCR